MKQALMYSDSPGSSVVRVTREWSSVTINVHVLRKQQHYNRKINQTII